MARDGTKALTQDLAQREVAHQRWADDGGRSPDTQPDIPKTDTPVMMPVRLVYHRRDRRFPRALLFAPTGTPNPAR
jgi:hypothetical protein